MGFFGERATGFNLELDYLLNLIYFTSVKSSGFTFGF